VFIDLVFLGATKYGKLKFMLLTFWSLGTKSFEDCIDFGHPQKLKHEMNTRGCFAFLWNYVVAFCQCYFSSWKNLKTSEGPVAKMQDWIEKRV
jgi:hypothetical protein